MSDSNKRVRRNEQLRVVCVQFDVKLRCVEENMKKATEMLEEKDLKGVDLVLLPEMAFTGYHFKDREDIRELMESETGPTFRWCSQTAKYLQCFVAAGFPLLTTENGEEKWYNALCFVSPSGDLVTTYAKTFLFDTDKTWSDEGPGFKTVQVPELGGKVGFGICMDINPKGFEDYSLYEFANYHKKEGTQLLIMLCNWLDPNIPKEKDPTLHTMGYWISRLKPLHGNRVNVVFCNRVGTEEKTLFVGASCTISMKEMAYYDRIEWKNHEAVLVSDVAIKRPE